MTFEKDTINLLPPEERTGGTAWNIESVSVVIFVLTWLVLFGLLAMQRWNLQARLRTASAQQQEVGRQLNALQKELGLSVPAGMNAEKISLIRNLLGERVLWSEVFKQFSQTVPRGLWFDSLEGSADPKPLVRIRGGALNYALVSEFMLGLERTRFFEKPDLRFAQKTVIQGRDVIGFEMTCGIRKTPGEKK